MAHWHPGPQPRRGQRGEDRGLWWSDGSLDARCRAAWDRDRNYTALAAGDAGLLRRLACWPGDLRPNQCRDPSTVTVEQWSSFWMEQLVGLPRKDQQATLPGQRGFYLHRARTAQLQERWHDLCEPRRRLDQDQRS